MGNQTLRALVFGHSADLIEAIPALLSRAGFEVCVISTSPLLSRCKQARRFIHVSDPTSLVSIVNEEARNDYALVIASDDGSLLEVKQSDLSVADKLRLLPLNSEQGLEHLCSKIGLSKVLKRACVPSPQFDVALTPAELARAAANVGFPLMLKADYGAGGRQVRSCETEADLSNLPPRITYPVLVQKKLPGSEIDCSGFFRDGRLVAFDFATVLTQGEGFGPSIARAYRPQVRRDARLVQQMEQLGRALGANGFVNISAIQSEVDGPLSFFEADMRPNVWVEHAKYFGEDPAPAIQASFSPGDASAAKHLMTPTGQATAPEKIVLHYVPRMPWLDFIRNKAAYLPYYENYLNRNVTLDLVRGQWTSRRLSSFVRSKWAGWRSSLSRRAR